MQDKSRQCRADIMHIMKHDGYFDKVMSKSDADFGRMKLFLQSLEKYTDKNLDYNENNKNLPAPRLLPLFPGLENKFVHRINDFPYLKILEKEFSKIEQEALSLESNESHFLNFHLKNLKPGAWGIYPLPSVDENTNVKFFPNTVKIVSEIPNRCLLYSWGNAVFSALNPGAHIPEHYSLDNFRLRCMLGVIVPEGCEMRVGTINTFWERGKILLFEDSFEHEVWNRGSGRRIILIFDIWHPDLKPLEIEALIAGFAYPKVREVIYKFLQGKTAEYDAFLTSVSEKNIFLSNHSKYWN